MFKMRMRQLTGVSRVLYYIFDDVSAYVLSVQDSNTDELLFRDMIRETTSVNWYLALS